MKHTVGLADALDRRRLRRCIQEGHGEGREEGELRGFRFPLERGVAGLLNPRDFPFDVALEGHTCF